MILQQGDVKLFQTLDDGEITVENGLVSMDGGLETSVYLSLFGGNESDDVSSASVKSWWANSDENDPAKQYRSETQNLLQSLPVTSFNLRRIEDAAVRDLSWFIEKKTASSLSVSASIPALNRIKLEINLEAMGLESDFTFVENWKAST